ncbi:hypothetical protein ykris0001_41920 [Yersinia kristensenii ATCC 33638]|nr:hypothetical protein ykris0001_41920 [Yersinia kristensenii ATCC 33638]
MALLIYWRLVAPIHIISIVIYQESCQLLAKVNKLKNNKKIFLIVLE